MDMGISTILSIAGTALQVIGGVSQSSSIQDTSRVNAEIARVNAENNRRVAEANKLQADAAAGQELAASQHAAERARREAMLAVSRLSAVAGASGGTVDSSLAAGLLAKGEYNARMTEYSGMERAKGLQYRGQVGVAETAARNEADLFYANAAEIEAGRRADATALGTVAGAVKGAGSIFSRYSPTDTPPGFQGDPMGFYD